VREIEAQFSNLTSEIKSSTPIRLKNITSPEKARVLFNDRRSAGAEANSQFDSGNHYQDGDGYVGAKPSPSDEAYGSTMLAIKTGFVSENVIKEVVDRHLAGELGREPLWGFLPSDAPMPEAERRRKLFSKLFNIVRVAVQGGPSSDLDKLAQEADQSLTANWWNTRRVRNTLKQAVRTALLEERATIRFFIPEALRDTSGQLKLRSDLASAVTIPQIEVLTSDKAGVFIDVDTQQEFGLYVYKTEGEKDAAWLTYVQEGLTILRIMIDGEADQTYSFQLGGRLLMYEFQRDPLITE